MLSGGDVTSCRVKAREKIDVKGGSVQQSLFT